MISALDKASPYLAQADRLALWVASLFRSQPGRANSWANGRNASYEPAFAYRSTHALPFPWSPTNPAPLLTRHYRPRTSSPARVQGTPVFQPEHSGNGFFKSWRASYVNRIVRPSAVLAKPGSRARKASRRTASQYRIRFSMVGRSIRLRPVGNRGNSGNAISAIIIHGRPTALR